MRHKGSLTVESAMELTEQTYKRNEYRIRHYDPINIKHYLGKDKVSI